MALLADLPEDDAIPLARNVLISAKPMRRQEFAVPFAP